MSPIHAPRRLDVTLRSVARAVALLCASLAAFYSNTLMAGPTEIDDEPLATRPTVKAKPNLMVLLDTSGSMARDYMPDEMNNDSQQYCAAYNKRGECAQWGTAYRYGYRSAQCNGVAYDPDLPYLPRVNGDGTSMGDATFPSGTHYYYKYKGSQPKMGWKYTTSGVEKNTFYNECMTFEKEESDKFEKVTVTSTSADKQKYANWYAYYRNRLSLMQTAMGLAMKGLDDGYRIGFASIHEDNFTNGGDLKFLGVDDFKAGTNLHKEKFYASLYGSTAYDATPLRKALANTGRYFGNRISGQTDPMQYSCQRNYALLTTDGYWNSENGTQLDGSTLIGQQDGAEQRPMRDDGTVTQGTVTVYTAPASEKKVETYSVSGPATQTSTKTSFGKLYTRTRTCTQNGKKTITTVLKSTATYSVTKVGAVVQSTTGITYDPDPFAPTSEITTTVTPGNVTNSCTSYTYDPSNPWWLGDWTTATVTPATDWTTIGKDSTAFVQRTPTSTSDSTFEPGTSTPITITSGGTPNTLADVAQYYWATDLRANNSGHCLSSASGAEKNVCANNVPTTAADPAKHQHMNTFAIGMGVSGTLAYDKNYLTQASGTYVDLSAPNGTLNWPKPMFSEYYTQDGQLKYSGNTGGPTNIDDLWHAAVNGRGQYYSAMDASSLSDAIAGVIASIDQTLGASSAAATSSLELVKGDNNLLYSASYTTGSWTGDLKAYKLKGETAEASTTVEWSSQNLLNKKPYADRKIYISTGTALASFEYSTLSATQKTHFDNMCSKSPAPTQCATLRPKAKAEANKGENLVNYLRGNRAHEAAIPFAEDAAPNPPVSAVLYRKREHVLGDIINGAPVYVGKPPFKYADTGYADFAATSRAAMIYVAANDGMLHAFNASSGQEEWAYIPTAVLPNLYKLANKDYAGNHEYFVDGAPVMGDIKVGTTWKTILVGGLNRGGKAYYALDITNPASPKLLWEFTHPNLGLSYGNPVITKKSDGTWIVVFGSGYNNADGKGRLFIVNANTGAQIVTDGISTEVGAPDTPSGLAKINAWVEDATDNTATRFYGGDLEGNVWRFDYEGLVEPKNKAMKLGTAKVGGKGQPITTKPMLLQAGGKPVVIVGTGRYLGEGDIEDATVQSVYAIKDPLTNSSWGDIRTNTSFVKQTLTVNTKTKEATITKNKVDWGSNAGWWVDLPNERERISTPMSLQMTTLVVPSTIPSGDACTSGGSSWLYYLNAATGSVINNTSDVVGSEASDDTVIVGTNWVEDSEGNLRLIYQDSQGQRVTKTPPVTGGGGATSAHRTSWRELID